LNETAKVGEEKSSGHTRRRRVQRTNGTRTYSDGQGAAAGQQKEWRRRRLTVVDDHVDQVHALGERVPEVDVVEGHDAALPLGALQRLAPLERLLPSHLVFIELGKIVDDNRNGQRNDQHAADTTDAADDLSQVRGRVNVAVADGGHGDAGPPERLGYGQELGVGFLLLGEVRQAGEYQHAHGQEQHEQAQLLVRVAQREPEALEAGRVTGQLEYAEYAHDAEYLYDAAHVVELVRVRLVRLGHQYERHEVRQYGQQVDHVQAALEELPLVGRRAEPEQVLEREPRDAHQLHHGEHRVVLDHALRLHLQRRYRVQRQCHRRHDDEQYRYHGYHLRCHTQTTARGSGQTSVHDNTQVYKVHYIFVFVLTRVVLGVKYYRYNVSRSEVMTDRRRMKVYQKLCRKPL